MIVFKVGGVMLSFNIIALYQPPTAKDVFYDNLTNVLKQCNGKEVILMGDFNVNWLDRKCKKKS